MFVKLNNMLLVFSEVVDYNPLKPQKSPQRFRLLTCKTLGRGSGHVTSQTSAFSPITTVRRFY